MTAYFRVEESVVLKKLGHDRIICHNAAFVFDRPLKIEPEDLLELTNGAVFLLSQGLRVQIPGKWDR